MKHLFVAGCPRSGTAALARLLNEHPAVALGIERFKQILNTREQEFQPDLFDPPRFLTVLPEDTNVVAHNRHLVEKFHRPEQIYFVDDKIPRLYRKLRLLRRAFAEAQLVVIFRDPITVALCWQARADDPQDVWPSENGAEKALTEWQVSVDDVAAAAPIWGDALIIVDYDAFFRVHNRQSLAMNAKRLFARLGLTMCEEQLLSAAGSSFNTGMTAGQRRMPIPPEIAARAAQLRESAPYQALIAKAV